MNYQEKLIEFMIQKRKEIGVRQGFDENDEPIKDDWGWYIDDGVLEAVKRWTEDISKALWISILYLIENVGISGVFRESCPFCLKYLSCQGCEYGEKYGFCGEGDSHYQKYKLSDAKIPNEKYIKIIKNIKRGDNDRG